ncbi:MAG: hypothetical protein ACPLW7_07000 [Minisyncoccia bacterium]|jgi:heterodisulfide reductase subunit A-like polyferredoxin
MFNYIIVETGFASSLIADKEVLMYYLKDVLIYGKVHEKFFVNLQSKGIRILEGKIV